MIRLLVRATACSVENSTAGEVLRENAPEDAFGNGDQAAKRQHADRENQEQAPEFVPRELPALAEVETVFGDGDRIKRGKPDKRVAKGGKDHDEGEDRTEGRGRGQRHGAASGGDREDQPDDGIAGKGKDLQDHEENLGAAEGKRNVLAGLAIAVEDDAMQRDGNDGKDDGLDHPLDEVIGRRDRPSPLPWRPPASSAACAAKYCTTATTRSGNQARRSDGHELPHEKAVGRPDGRKHGQACHGCPFVGGNVSRAAALRPIARRRNKAELRSPPKPDEAVASAARQLRYDRGR